VVNASGTATYTITVKNNGVVTASGVSISDLLPGSPAHFTNASAAPTLTYTPGGCATRTSTANPAIGSSTPAWSLWNIGAGCQLDLAFTVTVPAGTIPATYQNSASATYNGVTVSYNPLSSTAEDVAVRAPISAVKSFLPASIASGGQSTITFALTNSNPVAITAVGFTDTLPTTAGGAPGNMTIVNPVAPPSPPSTTCTGAPVYTAVNGSSVFTVSGLTVPASGSCTVSFMVMAALGQAAGIYVNTVPAGAISGSTGASTTPATASLTVANPILPPTIAKTFLTNPILPGGTTSLRFTLTNPNAGTAIGSAGFADSLPNNITVAATPNISNTCGGTVTAVAGSASISLNTNGTVPAVGSCTVSVDVTGTVPGIYQNTTGQVEGDTGTGNRASDSLTIMAPLIVQKLFLTNPVARATATTLQITLTNPNNFAVSSAAFLDTYPTGLINSTPANASVSCTGGGTATLQGGANGGSTVGITTPGSITAGNSCTVTVSVQAAAAGLSTNSTGMVTTTNAGTSPAVTAGLNVLAPPVVTKSFSPTQVASGGSTTMTIIVENPAANTATLTGVTLLDNYPTGMTNAAAGSAPVCTTGASANKTAGTGVSGGSSAGLDTGIIPPGGFCTITQLVATTQDATNTTNAPTSTNGGNGAAASAFLKFIRPLQVAKSFASSHLARRTANLMTITLTNPNNFDVTGAAFTDTYPTTPGAYLVNAGSNGTTYTAPTISGTGCTGTLTGANNGGSLALTGGTIPANSTCTYAINTQVNTSNVSVTNVTGPVTTTNAGTSIGDTATVSTGTADSPVEISKSFSPAIINVGQTSVLTFTINNPTGGLAKTNIGFIDVLPAGLSATNVGATAACGGNYTVTGGNTITLQNNGTLAAGVSSCTFTVTITANQPGLMQNHSGQVQYSATPLYGNYADATLLVRYPPTITKSFSDSTIVSGGTTAMTISLGNLNDSALTTSSVLTDTLPTSPGAMTIANGTVSNNTCPFTPMDQASGTLTAGDTAVRILNNSTIPAGGCQFTVYVTAGTAGSYTNTIAAGALATNAGGNATAATASLNIVAVPPTVSKAFLPSTIAAGGTSTVLITLYNPNSVPIALSSTLTDTFPTGVVTAGTPNRSTTCAGGTAGGTAGTLTLTTGTSIPPGTSVNPGSCTIQADVTAAASGIYTNTIPAAALSTNAGSNASPAQAVLTVTQTTPPTVSKAFGTTSIGVSGTTTLTLTLTNTNSVSATLTADLIDTLPTIAGPGTLVIGTPIIPPGSCPGTVTATTGSQSIKYASGGTIPAGGCTIVVNVTSTTAGAYTNTIAAGSLQTNLGNNSGPTSDTLNVVQASLNKAFSPTTIDQGGTSTLTFTLTNGAGNPAQSGINFTDNLPANVTVAAVPNITTTCPSGTGVVTAAAGSGSIVVTGATMTTASCAITVDVTGNTTGGPYNNTSANIVGTARLTNSVTSSGLTVNAKPALTKAFSTGTIGVGQTATLTFTVTNPAGAPARSSLTFTDTFPANLVIAAVPNVVNGCGGGATITAAAGTSIFTVAGSGINAAVGASTCTVKVDVTSSVTLSGYVNGAAQITAIGGMLNGVTNQTLNVRNVAVTKSYGTASIPVSGSSVLTFTLTNGVGTPAQTNLTFTDTLTVGSGLTVTGVTALSGAGCSATTPTFNATGNPSITLTGATIAAGATTCTFTATVQGNTAGAYNNVAANISGASSSVDTSGINSTLTVYNGATLGKAYSITTIGIGASSTLTFTINNSAGNPAQSALAFTDTFPAGLTVTAVGAIFGTGCSGTPAFTASTVALSAGAITIGNGPCTFTATIRGDTAATYVNNSARFSGQGGGLDTSATTATINVAVSVTGTVYADVNHNGSLDAGEAGTGQTLFVKLAQRSGAICTSPATTSAAADLATGAYTFTAVPSGDYCLILSNNVTLSDTTPTYPSGWLITETATGVRSITVGSVALAAQNFGMYNGGKLSGRVFGDTGVGAGIPNNGVQDGGESGLSNVTVRVTDNGGGTVYDSAVTAGNGNYTLWIPAAAGINALKVVETNPGSYVSTGGNAGTTGGSYDRASDTVTFTNTVGTIYTGVNFADVPGNTFVSNNSRSVVPGGVVFYPHIFTAGTGGIVTFTTSTIASPAIAGWSEVLYLDSNCNGSIDLGEPQITASLTASAGQQICILVKEFAPANAPINATNNVTVTARFDYSNSSPALATTLTLTDLTTVLQSGLTLLKYVDKASAKPGDTLIYTINYINSGFSDLNNVVISDNVPTYTNSPSPCCVGPTACLGTAATSYPPSIIGCTIITTSSSVTWTMNGTLNPGSSGQVKFSVKIDQ
jgi:uncharacterized repeat protein (TIGR01451 family)